MYLFLRSDLRTATPGGGFGGTRGGGFGSGASGGGIFASTGGGFARFEAGGPFGGNLCILLRCLSGEGVGDDVFVESDIDAAACDPACKGVGEGGAGIGVGAADTGEVVPRVIEIDFVA